MQIRKCEKCNEKRLFLNNECIVCSEASPDVQTPTLKMPNKEVLPSGRKFLKKGVTAINKTWCRTCCSNTYTVGDLILNSRNQPCLVGHCGSCKKSKFQAVAKKNLHKYGVSL